MSSLTHEGQANYGNGGGTTGARSNENIDSDETTLTRMANDLNINNNNNNASYFTGVGISAFKLPGGKAGEVIVGIIIDYVDIQSLCRFITTSFVKQLTVVYNNSMYLNNLCSRILLPEKAKYLNKKYKNAI